MSKLDDLIPDGETVLWRWPSHFSVILVFVILAMLPLVIVGLWYFDQETLWWAIAMATVFEAWQWFKLRKIITGLAVTQSCILIARGQFRQHWERLDKQDVDYATLRENRGHTYLHRKRGGTLKINDIGNIEALVAALGLPAKIWPLKRATGAGRGILYFTGVLLCTLWAASVLLILIYSAEFGHVMSVILSLGAFPVGLAGACMLAGAVGVMLARATGGDTLAEFIRAAGDPAWTGYRRKPGITFRYLNAIARLTGAEPVTPDTVEPVVVNGPLPSGVEGAE